MQPGAAFAGLLFQILFLEKSHGLLVDFLEFIERIVGHGDGV
jgi:hypothetical protein